VQWVLHGKKVGLKVQLGLSYSYDLTLNKNVTVVGQQLQNMIVTDVSPFKGEKGKLFVNQSMELYNPSYISIQNIGKATFDVLKDGVKIGETFVDNFNIHFGVNTINAIVTNTLNDTEVIVNGTKTSATIIISQFLSNWMIGKDQEIQLVGPTASIAPFLLHTVDNTVTVKGSKESRLISYATLSNLFSVDQLAYNPVNIQVVQSNMVIAVASQDLAISYGNCVGSKALPNLTRSEPVVLLPRSRTNVTMDLDNKATQCDAYRILAAFCGLLYSNRSHSEMNILTTAVGSFDFSIQDFTIRVNYQQDAIPLHFELPEEYLAICDRPTGTPNLVHHPLCFTAEGFFCDDAKYWMNRCNGTNAQNIF